ncbi:prepilin-type N-terminal cleavage/methylation domain-containing protein [Bacillaceae bacterium Marseille-Q3522]|nr:prepilin-type N-terminal cleavage/methylation domain-containing protein [Bacillaceae bacterium Marseille-Q3522]
MLKNNKGFTLVEMLIVLLIISVLLAISIPNVTKHNSTINEKGCEAYVKMVQTQVFAYEMDLGRLPESISELAGAGYLKENETTCPNGKALTISSEGIVTVVEN